MNVASTVEIASVVDPNTSPSFRVQSISRMRPEEPDRKKQASRIARMGANGLYTIGGGRPIIWTRELGRRVVRIPLSFAEHRASDSPSPVAASYRLVK